MSINAKLQQLSKTTLEIPQKIMGFVLGGFQKIFTPSEDEYPAIGVQPFEGDPDKEE